MIAIFSERIGIIKVLLDAALQYFLFNGTADKQVEKQERDVGKYRKQIFINDKGA